MKFVKGISLFFVYPLVVFGIGFFAGVKCTHFFYPGTVKVEEIEELPEADWPGRIVEKLENTPIEYAEKESGLSGAERITLQEEIPGVQEVASEGETLSVDTEYVLEETDIINQSVVETVLRLPNKYVGLNREQFLTAMEEYETYPPLSELERGFVSLEVLAFSRERVVIQMNYRYLEPSNSFYLAVRDNEVVVYLEDKETIYIHTGILLEDLPEDVQSDIIQMLWVENEEKLYQFLENYSS